MLLEHPGEVVSREEIRRRLWPNDTVVEFEHSISAAMNRLRQALGDSAGDPSYIETLARRGYRWMRSVEWVDAGPAPLEILAAPAVSLTASLIGKKVSHYRVLEFLGGGGMGIIYKAEDIKLGRRVALKFLPEELTGDQRALERFEREARAASALNHPNICTIHEIAEHDGQPFIVMELLEGKTLRDMISATASHKPLELAMLLDLAIQITAGLEAAHQKGIIHRDIKPSNIFITHRGEAKILDFGVAKLLELDEPTESAVRSGTSDSTLQTETSKLRSLHLTRTGAALGTEGYMSPEQVRGENLDARTDLFSFGLVLYEMATGQRAFSGDTVSVLHEAILKQAPVSAKQLNPGLPPSLEQSINKALEKARGPRYQSAAQMRGDLMSIPHPRQATTPKPRIWKLAATLAVLVCVIAAGWIIKRQLSSWRVPNPTSSNMRIVPLTDLPGTAWGAVFSPDAKLFAFFWNGENPMKWDLYVQLVGGEKPVRITHTSGGSIYCAAWSPDGREIAFGRCDDHGGAGVFVVPALGGPERKLTDVVCFIDVAGPLTGHRMESRWCSPTGAFPTDQQASWSFPWTQERSAA
jgi:serine/threonine protein kinase